MLDAVITHSVDVTFDWIWRSGATDTTLATWTAHYDPRGGGNYDAEPFEYDMPGIAVDTLKGDKLVFRYTADAAAPLDSYIPNGDGVSSNGRIPNITLPK